MKKQKKNASTWTLFALTTPLAVNIRFLVCFRIRFFDCIFIFYVFLVIWVWQLKDCYQHCTDIGQDGSVCCVQVCGLQTVGALIANTDADGSPAPGNISAAGITYSFMLSVGNDTQWTPLITETSNRCVSQFAGDGGRVTCEVIPEAFYHVINCGYIQNYLKCPTWNPAGINECQYTYQFVKLCMAEGIQMVEE